MAKIPLRTYNREIEGMIDRGQAAQAIDHCLHILKFYPKHIDTYRLLGKAYLELQKYSEAEDVLQRVLACIPDDFIAHIGMGIIREDEGNLDAAIWHMERAFEVLPSNVGVQDELRRLYGRRDGVQPEKIRLTRGALVRMYARGELYQQAIAEIRAALVEDPQRVDLETLLARMYYHLGQKVAATEVCTRLIAKLPFCFEANRILAEVLPGSARAEDAKYYLQRVHAMDPYLAHLSPEILTSAEVADNAVEVERLEWLPDQKPEEIPDWAKSIGAEWIDQDKAIPDWIAAAEVEEENTEVEQPEAPPPFSAEGLRPAAPETEEESVEPLTGERVESQIPEWMQQAGWEPASGESAEEPLEELHPEEPPEAEGETEDIEQAEIPDWLAAIAPQLEPEPAEPEAEDTEWLENILPPVQGEHPGEPAVEETTRTSAFIDELDQMSEETTEAESEQVEPAALPIEELEEIVEKPPEFEYSEEGSTEFELQESESAAEETVIEQSAELFETPDWLACLQAGQSETSDKGESELPSWLEQLSTEASEELPEGGAEQEAELTEASQSEPARERYEEPVMEEPDKFPETKPEINLGDTQPTRIKREEPSPPEEEAAPEKEIGETEFEEAMSWLDTLSVTVETQEEFAPTQPEEEGESLPDWIQEIRGTGEEPQLPSQGFVEEGVPAKEEAEIPAPPQAFIIEEEASLPPEGTMGEEAPLPEAFLEELEAPVSPEAVVEESEEAGLPEAALEEEKTPLPLEEILEDKEGTRAIFEEEFTFEQPVEEVEAETEEEVPTPVEELEALFEKEEEIPAESEPTELGLTDQFLEALEALPPEGETAVAQPEEITAEEAELPVAPAAEVEGAAPMEEELPDWLKEMLGAEEEAPAEAAFETPQAVEAAAEESLSWLHDLQLEEEPSTLPSEEIAAEEIPIQEAEAPEIPGAFIEEEVQPEEEVPAEIEGLPEWLRGVDEEKLAEEPLEEFKLEEATVELEETEAGSEWVPEIEVEEPFEEAEPSLEDTSPLRITTEVVIEGVQPAEILKHAQEALDAQNLDRALENYERLIQSGQHLEDTIHDLRDALYRYPVDASLWQLLGDAYMKSNQLQDALEAYIKAEELLR